ncbi:MAG: motility associated factor glycosyltransferase family protein [Vampirovibrionales bacterium]
MMMTFLAQNLQALQVYDTRHASLIEALLSTPELPEDAWEAVETEEGTLTLKLGGVPLQALTGGQREARQVWQEGHTPRSKVSTHIIFGFGMGYLAQLASRESAGRIVIYEDHLPLLKFLLTEINFTTLFRQPNITVVSTLQALHTVLCQDAVFPEKLDVFYAGEGYRTALWSEEKREAMAAWFKSFTETLQLGLNTYYARHTLQVQNVLKNLVAYRQWYRLEAFHQALTWYPAVVIGRGPSLDEALPTLKRLAEEGRTVLFAVGGALRRLSECGIKPHFAFFYDPVSAKEQFYGLPEGYMEDIILLVPGFAPPETFELAPEQPALLYCSKNNEFVGQFLAYLAQSYHPTKAPLGVVQHMGGGGVAVVTTDVALRMGCSHVALAGIDLAMKGNQVYAGGVHADSVEDGVLTLHTTESHSGYTHHLVPIAGQCSGETLLTTSDFKQYRDELAYLRTLFPQQTCWNISVGGADISGFTAVTPEALYAYYQAAYTDVSEESLEQLSLKQRLQACLQPLFPSTTSLLQEPQCGTPHWFLEALPQEARYTETLLQGLVEQLACLMPLLAQSSRDTLLARLPVVQQGTHRLLMELTRNPMMGHFASVPMTRFQHLYGHHTPRSTQEVFHHLQGQVALFQAMIQTLTRDIVPVWHEVLEATGHTQEAQAFVVRCQESLQTLKSLTSEYATFTSTPEVVASVS